MNEKLKRLYQEIIIQHNDKPYHFKEMESAPIVLEAYNPTLW